MTLSEFYDEVARRADTAKTKINAAETKRVLSEAFRVLSTMRATELTEVLARGMARVRAKAAAR